MPQKLSHGKHRYEESHKVEWKHYADEIEVNYGKAIVFVIVIVGVRL